MSFQRFHTSASIALLRTLLFCINLVFMVNRKIFEISNRSFLRVVV